MRTVALINNLDDVRFVCGEPGGITWEILVHEADAGEGAGKITSPYNFDSEDEARADFKAFAARFKKWPKATD